LLKPEFAASLSTLTAKKRRNPNYNVVGLGLGEKVSRRKPKGCLALRFLVQRKYAPSGLAVKFRLPSILRDLPTDVVEIGTPRLFTGGDPRASQRPLAPGCSIGFSATSHAHENAGTLGAVVTDGARLFLLSCNHVIADQGRVPVGTDIVQPGLLDRGHGKPTVVGKLADAVEMSSWGSRVDCAIASVDSALEVTREIMGIGAPRGVAIPRERMNVIKFGRSTGLTRGRIKHVNQSITFEHRHGWVSLNGQVEIEGTSGVFAVEGDSGALVLDNSTMEAVGMLTGGTTTFAYACALNEVLAAMRVELA
jgi:hypothetical protein